MEDKIQLKHPAGKHAVTMAKEKYESMAAAILSILEKDAEVTHAEMTRAVTDHFRKNNIKFEGSVEWYLESVKLDLEANKIIKRISGKSSQKFKWRLS
jgi:type II secretory pathway component PulJ